MEIKVAAPPIFTITHQLVPGNFAYSAMGIVGSVVADEPQVVCALNNVIIPSIKYIITPPTCDIKCLQPSQALVDFRENCDGRTPVTWHIPEDIKLSSYNVATVHIFYADDIQIYIL